MEYFREELFPCVSLTAVQTDKFKTGCMTAYLLTQLHRETAAENAVLPYVLRRGTKSLPDMRRISERLDALYGTEIEPSVRKLGEIQAVGFYAGFAEDAFLPGETDVLGEVISLLSELWLSPATRGGLFLPAYVDSEREQLIERIERLAPQVMRDHGMTKPICANIDLYTGFIYKMLGVPETLFTPLFAVARMAGWSAHRMEELFCAHRIIRPAYRPVIEPLEYKPLADR